MSEFLSERASTILSGEPSDEELRAWLEEDDAYNGMFIVSIMDAICKKIGEVEIQMSSSLSTSASSLDMAAYIRLAAAHSTQGVASITCLDDTHHPFCSFWMTFGRLFELANDILRLGYVTFVQYGGETEEQHSHPILQCGTGLDDNVLFASTFYAELKHDRSFRESVFSIVKYRLIEHCAMKRW